MDHTDWLSRENAALRDLVSRLGDAGRRINESLDFDAVLQEVLDSARALTGARYGVVTLLDASGRPGDFLSSGMTAAEAQRIWDTPDGMRIFEYLDSLAEPLRIPDLLGHLRSLGLPGFQPPASVGPAMSFLAAPVLHRGERAGYIFAADKEGGSEFTGRDQETLVLFASQAGLVIANARRHRDERQARADLETLVDTAPVGVLLLDAATGVPVPVNREAGRILVGAQDPGAGALEGVTVRQAGRPDVSLGEFLLERVLRPGEAVRAEEVAVQGPSGRSVTALVNATPIPSETGRVQSVVVTLQDMTPLEETERLRAEFLARMSRELREPLVSIKGSAATVLSGSSTHGPAEMMQFFRIIDGRADHLSGLINDLLDLARIDTGTLPVNPEPVRVAALVDRARGDLPSGRSGREIRADLPAGLPRVMADPRRMAQVLVNLFSTGSGTSQIRVMARSDDFHVAVSVEDRGSGLDPEVLPSLFGKFSLAGSGEQEGNTGLRLAISRGIVEAHGGRIWAESAGSGRGVRFTFTLPVTEEAPPPRALAARSRRRSGMGQPPVLVVDDDPQTQRHLRSALAEAGYAMLLARDPQEALRFMAAMGPQMALLDLGEPGAGGIELMRELRAVAEVPVIFLAEHGQEDRVVSAFDEGADDYLLKPFSATELAARVHAALRRRPAPGPAGTPGPYLRGDLALDFSTRRVSLAGRPVRLTALEYRLLAELAANAGGTLTYSHLLQRVWDTSGNGDLRPVRSAVRSLRRKLGDSADQPSYIFTEPGVGYCLAPGEEPDLGKS